MPEEDQMNATLYAIEGSVARITLNRPEKRNALNDELIAGIKRGLRAAAVEPSVRAVVISGAGKDFCSGADLSAVQKISEATITENASDARSMMELFTLMRELPIPVIAAVQGRALAGGCGLASAADLVLAAESARFGYPEVKIGFVPAMVMAILRRNVSEKQAFELLTRGGEITARRAYEVGLVNQVYADEAFESEVQAYACVFEKMSRSAVTLSKALLYQIDGLAFREAIETGADVNVIARLSRDCQQGIAGFLKK
ncbi:MAG: enoyl-CoA hydratase/isomerase family protein [Acidobacteriota bacterium]|nr:enoyl-CoA hydratase/isomerase family protein [Acidobacteriota bacterium]